LADRFRPGALAPRTNAAGKSLRQLAKETRLSFGTVLSAAHGRPVSPSTRAAIGRWLQENPPVAAPELADLLVVVGT